MKLKRTYTVDNSTITVNYEKYDNLGIWTYCTTQFKSKSEADKFINSIRKDFHLRLKSVEKRTSIYEKFK